MREGERERDVNMKAHGKEKESEKDRRREKNLNASVGSVVKHFDFANVCSCHLEVSERKYLDQWAPARIGEKCAA